jgi:hypothetical protein
LSLDVLDPLVECFHEVVAVHEVVAAVGIEDGEQSHDTVVVFEQLIN